MERKNTLLIDHIDLLRDSVRMCKQKRPFHIDAWVVLPEQYAFDCRDAGGRATQGAVAEHLDIT